ncbi:MAG: hypothetical protein LBJ20_01065 [Candidatus Methanoplasma sp.]|jgi:hypothetical protein|nr:hypothetical protein [Candidatus Methanoplasma sp.]
MALSLRGSENKETGGEEGNSTERRRSAFSLGNGDDEQFTFASIGYDPENRYHRAVRLTLFTIASLSLLLIVWQFWSM